ncbi:MAG: hypothetical protein MMC23_007820 [Stictis urceolatum]|nr:hypothetical protein [Stictis urceolata]
MLTFASNDDPAVLTSWRHRLPALALRFPYLLNAVLATAALHLAVGGHGVGMTRDAGVGAGPSERGEKGNGGAGMEQEGEGERAAEEKNILGGLSRETYAGVHQTYFDLVLSQHRAAIDVLCADNADAVCMTSVFISNHGFLLGARQGYTSTAEMGALSREGARRAGQGIEGYEIPLHWLQLSAGIREVIRCVNDGLLAEDAIVRVLMSSFEWGAVDRMIRSEEAGVVFERLEDFERSPEPEGLEPRSGVFVELEEEEVSVEEVYRRALRYLGHVYLSIQGGETKARIARLCMSFTSMIPRAFVTLVEQRRPRAFVVLARLFAMTMPIGDVWWFRGVAERHVRGIGGIVPRDWQWAMEWPRQVIRGEIWTPALINMLR